MNCAFLTEHPEISTALAAIFMVGVINTIAIGVSLYLSYRRGK